MLSFLQSFCPGSVFHFIFNLETLLDCSTEALIRINTWNNAKKDDAKSTKARSVSSFSKKWKLNSLLQTLEDVFNMIETGVDYLLSVGIVFVWIVIWVCSLFTLSNNTIGLAALCHTDETESFVLMWNKRKPVKIAIWGSS